MAPLAAAGGARAGISLGGQSKTDRGWNDRELLDRTEGVLGSGNRLVPISPVEMDGSSWSVVPSVSRARKNRRGMRPAGGIKPCPPRVKNEPTEGEGKTHAIPLSVEAEAVAPADLAGTVVLAVAGTRFLAVVEVHSSAVDIHSAVVLDPMVAPRKDGGLMDEFWNR